MTQRITTGGTAIREGRRGVILVAGSWSQPTCAELERLATAGERPRKDYVELARALDADVIDGPYMAERATPLARAVARRAGLAAGQVTEAFLRQGRVSFICALADQLGLPLALVLKLARGRRDLVMTAHGTSLGKEALFFTPLGVQSHLGAIVHTSSVQLEIAATHQGVERSKLRLALPPVDERFWSPLGGAVDDAICAVGWEARDYATLVSAVRDLDLQVDLELSSVGLPAAGHGSNAAADRLRGFVDDGLPPNVRVHQLGLKDLRRLYARSRFVVLPLVDVEYAAGSSALTEAMAMGKAVIVTRTRGQVDYVRDREHGLYVPPGNPTALREAIEFLATHPAEAERMGRAGRALVEQRLTLDGYVEQLVTAIRDATGCAGPRPARTGLHRRVELPAPEPSEAETGRPVAPGIGSPGGARCES